MNLLRLDPPQSLRLLRHRGADLLRRHTRRLLSHLDTALHSIIALPSIISILLLLPIPRRRLRQSLLIARQEFPLPGRQTEHLTHAHENGYGAGFEYFIDAGPVVSALGCGTAHFIVNGFEHGQAGVDDAEEGFERGQHGDEGVGLLRVGGDNGGGVVDAVECKSADAGESSHLARA